MHNTFFTSDWHLWHRRIQEYCPASRKGDTPEEMTELILSNIEEQTKPGDVIYNIGDVSFGTVEQTVEALKRILNLGVKHHLILGNHDKRIRENDEINYLFDSVQDALTINFGKQVFDLCHMQKTTWDRARYGAIHLHGHTHSTYQPIFDKCLDVGIDTRAAGDMKMYHVDDVLKIMKFCESGKHH